MKINVLQNTIKSSLWGILSKIVMLFCAFIVRSVIVYKLGVEYVGLDGLFTSVLSLLNLSELGIGSAIVFSMYSSIVKKDYDTINQLLYLYRKAYLLIAGFILCIGVIVSLFVKSLIHGETPVGINVYILFYMFLLNTVSGYLFASYRTSVFAAYQRNDIKARIQLVSDIFQYGLQIIVLLSFENYYLYIGVMLITIIPRNIMYLYASRKHFPRINPSTMPTADTAKGIFRKVLPLLGHKVGGAFLVSIDSIVISAFLGLSILGKYNNYYYIITALIGIISIIQQALIAGIGNRIIVLSPEQMLKMYNNCAFVWHWIIGWCTIALLCLIQPFITIWLGRDYLLADSIAIALAFYFYLWQFRIIGMTFKDAGGLWENDWYKPYIGMIVNALLSISLVYITKNIIFVLIPTCFVFAFLYFPVESLVISKGIFKCKLKNVLLPSIVDTGFFLVIGAFTYLICIKFLHEYSVINLFYRAIVVLVVPNVLLILCYYRTSQFKAIVSYLKRLRK
ncbi:oligosaccharide flippase family protein [Blautia sp. JLR.GB0024]|uniref:oligosaccharide flippase family protein n=1 Tax=Blautia sp. JLR.GB0024 TaxID=3123295 RepID=UPI003005B79D